ncbi:MAG: hypothetical protein NVSMB32_00510 [Actinomycetota bacterium]
MSARSPRILIASSSEAKSYAKELQQLLSPDVESLVWNQGLFVPGEFALESLESRSGEFGGAVVLATADDRVISRGAEHSAMRDNLLFEFGMFIAVFGRRRALLLVESVGTKLPSDVAGLTVIAFSRTTPAAVGMAPAATTLQGLAKSWRDRPYDPEIVERLERVLRLSLSEVQDRAGITSEFGIHVFLVDKQVAPPQLVRVARARSSPKSARNWAPFEKGVGVVGLCWGNGSSVFIDLTSPGFQNATRSSWDGLDPDDRFGLDFDMLKVSRERYKAVGAVPITTIRGGGEFLGCISYNLGIGSPAEPVQLRKPAVERVLDACAEMTAIVMGR